MEQNYKEGALQPHACFSVKDLYAAHALTVDTSVMPTSTTQTVQCTSADLYLDKAGMHRSKRFKVWHAASTTALVLKVHTYFAVRTWARMRQHEMK